MEGESIKRKDEAKRETIGQAHLFHTQTSTEGTYITVIQRNESNTRIQSCKKTQSKNQRRSTTEYAIHTATLIQYYLNRLTPPTDIYTKTPKEKEVATSLCASSSPPLSTSTPSSPRRGLRARTSRLHVWPFNATNGVPALSQRGKGGGEIVDAWGRKGGMVDAPSRWRGLGTAG